MKFFILPFSAFFKLMYFSFIMNFWSKINTKNWFITSGKKKNFDLERYLQHHSDRYFHYLKFKSTVALLSRTINFSALEDVFKQKYALYQHCKQMQINLDFIERNSDILQSYHGHYRIIDEERFVSNKQTAGGLCWELTKVFQPHGRGYQVDSKHNCFFEGLYREGLRFHGRIYHYDTKFIFYGLFDDGEPYDGIISMPSGRRYEGVVSSTEKPHGNGFLIFENGNYLHGIFNNGRFEKGVYRDFINDDTLQIEKVLIDFRDKLFESKLEKKQSFAKSFVPTHNTFPKTFLPESKNDKWVSV